jgi:hypothetical protein
MILIRPSAAALQYQEAGVITQRTVGAGATDGSQSASRSRDERLVKYIVPGEVYRDGETDLQLPRSHLAFRIPPGSTGRLGADGAFKIFSADRRLSCFVFVHGAGAPRPANWMSTDFALDGETLVAAGEQKHAQSDTVYRAFEGATLGACKFEKTNRQGAGLHGSAAALKSEAEPLSGFLKAFLASLHRGEAAPAPTPVPIPVPIRPPAPVPPPPPPGAPPVAPPRDRRLVGLWHYSPPTLRSGSASLVTFRSRYFSADGHFAQGGESFATFVRSSAGGQWAGMETWRSNVPSGERGTWETTRDVLTLHYDNDMYSQFRYYAEGNSLTLTQERREAQLWIRG